MPNTEEQLRIDILEYEKKYWINKELAAHFEHKYWKRKYGEIETGVDKTCQI